MAMPSSPSCRGTRSCSAPVRIAPPSAPSWHPIGLHPSPHCATANFSQHHILTFGTTLHYSLCGAFIVVLSVYA